MGDVPCRNASADTLLPFTGNVKDSALFNRVAVVGYPSRDAEEAVKRYKTFETAGVAEIVIK